MDFYQTWILPRFLDAAMRSNLLDCYRQGTVEPARGTVLEIGVGSGLNLRLYGPAVDQVCGIDPSPELLHRAAKRIADAHVPVSLVRASAEQLPFAAAAFDTLVMTWTLCSIPNPSAALAEMRRVLKLDGSLLFVEHGLSPEPRIAGWQRRLTPCWSWVSGGCHLDREADDLLRSAGFKIKKLKTGYMKGPKPFTFMYEGSAGNSYWIEDREDFTL
jgi:SAM-dependent methyltransferase